MGILLAKVTRPHTAFTESKRNTVMLMHTPALVCNFIIPPISYQRSKGIEHFVSHRKSLHLLYQEAPGTNFSLEIVW